MRKQVLIEKAKRIELKVKAMKKYEKYLENVRDQNNDEYTDLSEILARYWTLKNANTNLIETRDKLNKDLEDLKNEVTAYEKTMKISIMSLNNDNANF
mmetsp:Transcript_39787/g.38345  ORF Transcript_39787/g.38345 Transcript_39787/m.38345 type:complete len:98 (-) Transcript_39787:382-675(-)